MLLGRRLADPTVLETLGVNFRRAAGPSGPAPPCQETNFFVTKILANCVIFGRFPHKFWEIFHFSCANFCVQKYANRTYGRYSILLCKLASKSMLIVWGYSIVLSKVASKSMLISWGHNILLNKLASKSMLISWGYSIRLSKFVSKSMLNVWGTGVYNT